MSTEKSSQSAPVERLVMPRFCKRPVEIEAVQFTDESVEQIKEWAGSDVYYFVGKLGTKQLIVETFEGSIAARIGDWIIRGVAGEFYPCRPDIFEATYDAV